MNTTFKNSLAIVLIATVSSIFTASSQADPLPGRDLLKFDQQPMIATTITNTTGTTST